MTQRNSIIDEGALVLLRDENPERRRGLAAVLRDEGWKVVEAGSSASAIACLEQDTASLILAVASSSDTNAFSFCAMISRRAGWDTPPVLILLEPEDAHVGGIAWHTGATDLIRLPCPDAWLVARVRHHLILAKSLREMRRTEISHSHAERLASIGSWEWDTDTNQMRWSDETCRVLGHEPGEVEMTHTAFWESVHPEDRSRLQDRAGEALDIASSYTIRHRLQLPDGKVKHVQQQGELIVGDRRRRRWLAGTIQDMTQQRLDQDKIRYLANYDSLTGLANRRSFSEHLDQAIASARLEDRGIALLYIDLDRFKLVNDTLGHSAGDQLLRHVANILRAQTRGDDLVGRPERVKEKVDVSRLGGDEFIILLSEVSAPQDAGEVAQRILEALPEQVEIDGQQVSARASIGISVFPEDGHDGRTLIMNSDTAMYQAKESGRNTFKFFCHSMNEASQRKLLVDSRLRIALDQKKIQVHYQPKVDLSSGKIYGMEALARWNDPDLGGISPKEFIALAEESGLIVPLGRYILETACRDTQQWVREHGIRLKVSVNVSSAQFAREDFRQLLGDVLQETGLDPTQLDLEITESLMLQDDEDTAILLRDIRAMGVAISLDDFGTGYSSLSYLTRFPLDTLKLDRCFVRDIDTNPAAAGVTSAVISMAHSLGLEVIAEGVDADDQKTILSEWGCDAIQGFLISAALPASEFLKFLFQWEADREKSVS